MDSAELTQALESGDIEKVANFLESINQTPCSNDTVAQIFEKAAENQELAGVLQEKATKLAQKNQQGLSVLDHLAKTEAGGELIKTALVKPLLLSQKEDVLTQLAMSGWYEFSLPPESEVPEEAKILLSKLTDLRIKETLVQAAIRDGRLEDVKSTLGEDDKVIQAAGISGLLPLQQAVVYQNTDIVQYLISTFPQTIGFKDGMGRTAMHYAAGCQDAGNLYQILKDAGADDTVADLMGNTPAYYNENPDTIQASDVKSTLESLMQGQGKSGSKGGSRPISAAKDEEVKTEELDSDKTGEADTEPQEVQKPPTPPKPQTPPGPRVTKPVSMYVSSGSLSQAKAPPPSTVDGKYIAQHLGTALTLALAEIAEKRPWDPIEYLANWLYGYHKDEAYVKQQAEMLKTIREAEAKQNEIEELKFKRKEELRRLQEEDLQKQKEEEEEKRRQELEELQRSNKEAALAQKPQLPTVREDEEAEAELEADSDPNVKDRDTEGLTEMHKLASQADVDLVSLIDLGYSVADRDIKGRSVRDIAMEAGRAETVKAIDNYIKQLLADGAVDSLEKLVLEGYEDIETLADENTPEATRNMLQNIGNLKEKMNTVQVLSESGKTEEIKDVLEALPQLTQTKDKDGRYLLHRAVLSGNTEIVEHLTSQYPDMIHARDNANRTPLHYAYGKSEELASILVSKGAKQNAKDVYKRTAISYKENPENERPASSNPPVPTISEPEPEPSAAESEQQPANNAGEDDKNTEAPAEEPDLTPDPSQLATTTVTSDTEPQS